LEEALIFLPLWASRKIKRRIGGDVASS